MESPDLNSPRRGLSTWNLVRQVLNRPYPLPRRVLGPVAGFLLLVPGYLVIAALTKDGPHHTLELALDRLVPLRPAWALVYVSHLFFVFLPVLLMRQEEQIRRTFLAYGLVWSVGYVCFLAYPTVAPRPATVIGDDFFRWFLRGLYAADPPRNCFPSLHVAHASILALTCHRLHRGVGLAAALWAALIAVSTLYTKQHYVADVVAGVFLAVATHFIFLHRCPRAVVPALDRRVAPVLLVGLVGLYALVVAGVGAAFLLTTRGR